MYVYVYSGYNAVLVANSKFSESDHVDGSNHGMRASCDSS